MPANHQAKMEAGNPFTERVEDRTRVLDLLSRTSRQHRYVSVSLPGDGEIYTSTLLAIDPDATHIWLSGLTPADGHPRLLQARQCHITARCDAGQLRFETAVADWLDDTGDCLYRLPLPRAVEYTQRRSYHRVAIGLGHRLSLLIPADADNPPVQGQLRDLSLGGVGALLRTGAALTQGELLRSCALQIPAGERILCDLEIRYISQAEPGNLRFGGRFIELDQRQQRRLEKVVVQLERELLRKRPRGK